MKKNPARNSVGVPAGLSKRPCKRQLSTSDRNFQASEEEKPHHNKYGIAGKHGNGYLHNRHRHLRETYIPIPGNMYFSNGADQALCNQGRNWVTALINCQLFESALI
jgi:hypothetical protein